MEKYSFDKFTSKPIVEMYEEPAKNIPVVKKVDVLVVGGSQSGVSAALAAARHGAKVMLVERFGFLGGQSVYALVTQWEKRAFINNQGAVLTKGLGKEMLDRVVAKGDSDGLWATPPGCPEMRDGEEWLHPEAISIAFYELCEEAGVDLLLHTQAVDVIMHPMDSAHVGQLPKIKGVIFENKTGRFAIYADAVIDATADLDLVWKAIGEEGCGLREPQKRIGSGFYVYYGGVDTEKFVEWIIANPDTKGGYPDIHLDPDKMRKHVKESKLIKVSGTTFSKIMDQAIKLELLEPLEDTFEKNEFWGFISLGMKWVGDSRWCVPLTGLPALNMLDIWQVSDYEILRQKIAFYMQKVVRMIPGWEHSYLDRQSLYIGSRETRWLKAMKMINQDLIWDPKNATDPTPADTVGRSGAHDPGKNLLEAGYPIPYGMLVPEKLDGVIVCARAVGTQPDRSLDAHRGITPGLVTGQAAGTAAALAASENVELRNLDVSVLQQALRQDGVQLDHERMAFPFEILKKRTRKTPRKLEGTQPNTE